MSCEYPSWILVEYGLMIGMQERNAWRIWTTGKEDWGSDADHSSYRGWVGRCLAVKCKGVGDA